MDAEFSSGSKQGQPSRPSGLGQKVNRKAKKAPEPLRKQIAKRQLSGKELTASSPATTVTEDQDRRQPQEWFRMVQHEVSSSEVFDCAVDIFTRLSSDQRLASRVPHLYFRDRDELVFRVRDPRYTLDKLIKRVHPSLCFPSPIHHRHVRQVRRALIKEIPIMCGLRVAWRLDLSRLRIACLKGPTPFYLPFLETFDFEISNTARNWEQSEWEQFEKNAIQNVTKHFDVLELVAKIFARSQDRQEDFDVDSDAVANVLDNVRLFSRVAQPIICLTKKYTHKLAHVIISNTQTTLRLLPSHTNPPDLTKQNGMIRDHKIIKHILHLAAEDASHTNHDLCWFADRAKLLVIHAVVLVHLHAKVISKPYSLGLFEMDRSDDVVEDYTSPEGFQSVIQTRRDAKEAIQVLKDAGVDRECTVTCRLYGLSEGSQST